MGGRPPTKVRRVDFLTLDDTMIVRMLRDLTIYDYLPSLLPLRARVFRIHARAQRFRLRSPADADMLRREYAQLISMFHAHFRPDDFEHLRHFLRERCQRDVGAIILGDRILDSDSAQE
jgi:hypothetical protein